MKQHSTFQYNTPLITMTCLLRHIVSKANFIFLLCFFYNKNFQTISATGIWRKGSIHLSSDRQRLTDEYLRSRAVWTTWVRVLRRAHRAVGSQGNISSRKFISSDRMDEIIQILIIKIAGQKARQKDLEERISIILKVDSNTIKTLFENKVLHIIPPASK